MTRKLLLADDSVTIQRVIELTFSGEDVSVVVVGDGEQAIARIPIERPDIVLADIGMPKKNGYEVSAFVKGHKDLSHIPVLLLAGAFEPVDEARAKEVKCDGVLVKPFEPQNVIARVRELIDVGLPSETRREEREADAARGIVALARPSAPKPLAAPEPSPAPVDDYFDRLDAAFATLGNSPAQSPLSPEHDDMFGGAGVPTIEDLLGGTSIGAPSSPSQPARMAPPLEPPDTNATLASGRPEGWPLQTDDDASARRGRPSAQPDTAVTSLSGGENVIAEMFKLLFAVEQGERDPATVRIGPQPSPAVVTDDLVDEVARRVLEKLAPDTAKKVVADVVSEVAERLVRDEIARIRKLQSE